MNIEEIKNLATPSETAIADCRDVWNSHKQPENTRELIMFMYNFFDQTGGGLKAYQEKLDGIKKLSLHDKEIAEVIYQLEFLKQLLEKIADDALKQCVRERAVSIMAEFTIKKQKTDVTPEVIPPGPEIPPPKPNTWKIGGSLLLGIGILALALPVIMVGTTLFPPALIISLSIVGVMAASIFVAYGIKTAMKNQEARRGYEEEKTALLKKSEQLEQQRAAREETQKRENQDLQSCYDHIQNLFDHIQKKFDPAVALQGHHSDPISGARDVHAPAVKMPKPSPAETSAFAPDLDARQKKIN